MSEVMQRKERINSAIRERGAAAFAGALMGWLEATAYLRVLPTLEKLALPRGVVPTLSNVDLREESVREVADDAVMAFCISAGLGDNREAVIELHGLLTKQMGPIYPGSSAIAHCMQTIDPIVTLDDAVGQALKAMLDGKALDAKDIWNSGLRLLQRLRSSNFMQELAPLLAQWMRRKWSSVIREQRFNLTRPRLSVPPIETALADPADDQSFIAALLLAGADAADIEIEADYRRQLEAIARRP
ncbi:hypothetical protein [Methylocapsa acidiphila]|uniref:hypothetical protein n=1 Tax=Methylocapsa acidiphila TaxID=133552 RepID=UPI00056677CD|nr:hypothetical protein [Methylocapsa acidiphila]